VPSEHLHSLISQGKEKGILVPFLATQMKELDNIHPKIKVVHNLDRIGVEMNGDTNNDNHAIKAITQYQIVIFL
jgi:hypothetical protein